MMSFMSFDGFRRIQFIFSIVASSFLHAPALANTPRDSVMTCSAVKFKFEQDGYTDVPANPISGEHLQVCRSGRTCCTRQMEVSLARQSAGDFFLLLSKSLNEHKISFQQTLKFDAFILDLIEKSKSDLNEMFIQTYGDLYQQNSMMFQDLFRDLRAYYNGAAVNLAEVLNEFFTTLLQRMFTLMNQQYIYTESFFACTAENMEKLQPFGGIPYKLKAEIKRSFTAARTFSQGLMIGRDVLLTLSKLEPTQSCLDGITRMLYCPVCRGGLVQVRPCYDFCLNTMKGCLAQQAEFQHVWDKYLDEMVKVAERLEGPFSVKSVVNPMDVRISDAIMIFQENSESIASKVFHGCGQLEQQNDTIHRILPFNESSATTTAHERPTTASTASSVNFEKKLLKDINRISASRGLWITLPQLVCNVVMANSSEDEDCWNGVDNSGYLKGVVDDGIYNQLSNPEVKVNVSQSVAEKELLKLRLITNELRSAYNGVDVQWLGTGEDDFEESGDDSEWDDEEEEDDDSDDANNNASNRLYYKQYTLSIAGLYAIRTCSIILLFRR